MLILMMAHAYHLSMVVQIHNATNYDADANTDDGSCVPFIYGCTDSTMWNYNDNPDTDDDSCIPCSYGCTDPKHGTYNPEANIDDGSCIPWLSMVVWIQKHIIHDATINIGDGSCWYAEEQTHYDCHRMNMFV